MSEPWMKFYPRDWRGDQALRAVGLSARGLWIECLCIMHEAKPYGHLVLNGNPVDGGTLARMTGIPVDEVSALLAELRQAGVLSVTGKGVVFSRRMTKDHARAQKGRKAANKRWSQVPGDVEQSGAPNGSANGSPTTQKPEAILQKAQQVGDARLLYDKLIEAASARGQCHEKLAMGIGQITDLIAQGYDLDRDILPVIREKARPDIASWKFFATIIIQRATERSAIPAKVAETAPDWQAWCSAYFGGASWPHGLGPKPDEPGCKAPADVVEQARKAAA